MYKKLSILFLVGVFFTSYATVSAAQSISNTDLTILSSAKLLEKIAELQAQVKALTQKNDELSKKLELARQLKTGAQGDDVLTLQKILATDKTIYPEGLTTGFFGEKTKEAVKRLQGKFGLGVSGELDEKTKELINKILTSQGVAKEIPPGLLIAPGLKDRVRVKFENKDGKFEYRIEVGDDDLSDDDSKLEIEVEKKSNNRSKVKIDWRNDGKRFKRVIYLNTHDESEIAKKVSDLFGLDEAVVKAAIDFDDEDDDDGDDTDDDGGRHGGDDDDDGDED